MATKDALGEFALVFHLAADPEVQAGSQDPERQLKQNLLTTFNLLEAIRARKSATRLVFASSSTVYGEPNAIPTPEDYAPLLPISMYGATKLGCEALIAAYTQLVPLKTIILRFANVVGTRAGRGVIFDFIKKLRKNHSELEVLGDGSQSKSYLHIDDCVDAFLMGLDDAFWQSNLEIFNIGTEDRTNVLEIAQIVIRAMNLTGVAVRTAPGPDGRGWTGDVKTMQLDITKIKKRGWAPKRSSRDAVRLACEQLLAQES
jgi:UDP-glucose 4-epimerase